MSNWKEHHYTGGGLRPHLSAVYSAEKHSQEERPFTHGLSA